MRSRNEQAPRAARSAAAHDASPNGMCGAPPGDVHGFAPGMPAAAPPRYHAYDRSPMPVAAMAADYTTGHITARHQHPHAQLVHAVRGVMVVSTQQGQWIVPPSRGMWVPGSTVHSIRMVGNVQMRTAYIRPDAAPDLPARCTVLAVSPLLRELILAAIDIPLPYDAESRNGRLMRLLLDEISLLPALPMHLPRPSHPDLRQICDTLSAAPDNVLTLAEWSTRLRVDARTIQRRFDRETGMTFGQWRQQVRLLAALERLARGMKIVDVALDLGYASPSAFAAMFRRQFGMPPSAFFG